ncbi:MAG: hypothetical protein IKH82_01770 [Clostridiales bacterium]|nr:hypothetical protein [Clostridiales bacterium]MBR6986781.1 hypothetical protein [Clostridiales bacterium]
MSDLKATTSRSSFWKDWKEKREAKKQERQEEAVRATTDKIAENENKIIGVLESVDFLHSKLPDYILEQKTVEDHPYGDLEYAAKALALFMKKNPQDVILDIREIDEKILALAYMFRDAVKNGEPNTAQATKSFLTRGITQIRTHVPSGIKDNAKIYVESYVKYLDTCITYCELARTVDKLRDAVISDEETLQPMEENYKDRVAQYKAELQADEEKAKLAKIIAETYDQAQRSTWSEDVRKVHIEMIELALSEVSVELQRVKLIQDETKLTTANGRLDVILVQVQNMPLVTDPNEMNKFQETVDDIFREIAKTDQEIDESLRTMEDIDERIKQIDSLPGSVRAREIASEKMQGIIEELKKEQEDELSKSNEAADAARRSLGIKTQEEMEELKKEQEVQQSEILESMMNIN